MSADRENIFSVTHYYPMCTEECGWEGEAVVSHRAAQVQVDTHNMIVHGDPKLPPPGGWRWQCERDRWQITASSQDALDRGIAEHLRTHRAADTGSTGPELGTSSLEEAERRG